MKRRRKEGLGVPTVVGVKMSNPSGKTPFLALSLLAGALAACGGSSPPPATPSSLEAPTPPSTQASAAATPARTEPNSTTRDPKIVALAKSALECKFEDDAFDDECAGYKAWSDNEDLFEENKADETLFSMIGDPDVKVRVLAAQKSISREYFEDKAHARSLFALAKKETNGDVAGELGSHVANVDATSQGLDSELRALAKHPRMEFRRALASVISKSQTPSALEVIEALLQDSDLVVQRAAIRALSTGGITPGVDPVCKLLIKQVERTDELHSEALWSASSSNCEGMPERVIDELNKRTTTPSKIVNAVGVGYSLAASSVCRRTKTAALKKKGYDIGRRLVDAKVPDSNTRRSGINVLTACDKASATAVLRGLAKDKDKGLAKSAQTELDALNKKRP